MASNKLGNKERKKIIEELDSAISDLHTARRILAGCVDKDSDKNTADNAANLSQETIDNTFNFIGTGKIGASSALEKLRPFVIYSKSDN